MSKKFIIGASIALAVILIGGVIFYFLNQASADMVATKDFCNGTKGAANTLCVKNAGVLRAEMAKRDTSRFKQTLKNMDALRNFVPPVASPSPTPSATNGNNACPAVMKTCPDNSTVGYDTTKPGCVYKDCPTTTLIQPSITSFTASTVTLDPITGPAFKITLNWVTANTTGCTASAVPEIASWSGVKPTTGTATFDSEFPAAFSKLTLTCTGATGTTPVSKTLP